MFRRVPVIKRQATGLVGRLAQLVVGKGWLTRGVWGLVVVLAGFQFYFSNHLASAGKELAVLRVEKKELVRENMLLAAQISELSSLEQIAMRAKELGFESVEKVAYLKLSREVAYLGGNEKHLMDDQW